MSPKTIIRDSIYSTDELREILTGHVSIDTMRQYGLVGLASGYWSNNVIAALDRFCASQAGQGDAGSEGRENPLRQKWAEASGSPPRQRREKKEGRRNAGHEESQVEKLERLFREDAK